MVNGPAEIRTIGAPSSPRLASVDETACLAVEGCGSAAPRQIAPVMKLIPATEMKRDRIGVTNGTRQTIDQPLSFTIDLLVATA